MIFAFMSISLLGPSGRMGYILDCLGQVNAGLYKFCIWVEFPVQRRLCPIF